MIKNEIDINDLIVQKLKEKERSVRWLAKKVGCDDSNLRKTLKGERYIYADLLFRISVVLEEDFFVYYSKKLNNYQVKNT